MKYLSVYSVGGCTEIVVTDKEIEALDAVRRDADRPYYVLVSRGVPILIDKVRRDLVAYRSPGTDAYRCAPRLVVSAVKYAAGELYVDYAVIHDEDPARWDDWEDAWLPLPVLPPPALPPKSC